MIARHYIATRRLYPDEATYFLDIAVHADKGETVHIVEPERFHITRNGNAYLARDTDGEVIGTFSTVREAVDGGVEEKEAIHGF